MSLSGRCFQVETAATLRRAATSSVSPPSALPFNSTNTGIKLTTILVFGIHARRTRSGSQRILHSTEAVINEAGRRIDNMSAVNPHDVSSHNTHSLFLSWASSPMPNPSIILLWASLLLKPFRDLRPRPRPSAFLQPLRPHDCHLPRCWPHLTRSKPFDATDGHGARRHNHPREFQRLDHGEFYPHDGRCPCCRHERVERTDPSLARQFRYFEIRFFFLPLAQCVN
jgi:hypothetical protein